MAWWGHLLSHKPKIVLFYFIWCALGCSFHCDFVTEVFNVSIHAVNWTVRTMCTAALLLHEVLNQTVQQRLLKDFCHNLTEHKLQMGKSIQQVAFLPKTGTHHAFSKDVPLQTSLHRVHQERIQTTSKISSGFTCPVYWCNKASAPQIHGPTEKM